MSCLVWVLVWSNVLPQFFCTFETHMAKFLDRIMIRTSIIPMRSSNSYITSFVSTRLYDFVIVRYIGMAIQIQCHIFADNNRASYTFFL